MSRRDALEADAKSATDELLKPTEVAEEWKIPEKTLAQWRYLGRGPEYLKLGGHIRYRRSALRAWETECSHSAGGTAA